MFELAKTQFLRPPGDGQKTIFENFQGSKISILVFWGSIKISIFRLAKNLQKYNFWI